MSTTRPIIALTTGEPAGIGPDLAIRIAQTPLDCHLTIIGDRDVLRARAKQIGVDPSKIDFSSPNIGDHISLVTDSVKQRVTAGHLDPANVAYVMRCLDRAIAGCCSGEFDAMVTGPVHKGVINDAGIQFTGHTEYIANKTDTDHPVMILVTKKLRVALVTTHVPLKDVATLITPARLEKTLAVLINGLQQEFAIANPRIAVCGLNPHAGEQGYLGHEDKDTIAPVVAKFRRDGYLITGPLPADTLFVPDNLDRYDAELTMYHDQGLPVIKHLGFSEAVNLTLGLPIIRTSVDHGTALDLAGRGPIDHGSTIAAIRLAIEIAKRKSQRH